MVNGERTVYMLLTSIIYILWGRTLPYSARLVVCFKPITLLGVRVKWISVSSARFSDLTLHPPIAAPGASTPVVSVVLVVSGEPGEAGTVAS
jgi:hypothetical protein